MYMYTNFTVLYPQVRERVIMLIVAARGVHLGEGSGKEATVHEDLPGEGMRTRWEVIQGLGNLRRFRVFTSIKLMTLFANYTSYVLLANLVEEEDTHSS